MGRGFIAVVVVLVALALAAGCHSLAGRGMATKLDDAAITASVKTMLVAEMTSNLTRVDVDTNRGTLYLTGSVDNTKQKRRAEQLARQASGVKSVVNNLQVAQTR